MSTSTIYPTNPILIEDSASREELLLLREQLQGRLDKRKANSRVLQNDVERINARLRNLVALPEAPAIGQVITFGKRFSTYSVLYQYAALRTAVGWFVTGESTDSYTWPELLAFIAERNIEIPSFRHGTSSFTIPQR